MEQNKLPERNYTIEDDEKEKLEIQDRFYRDALWDLHLFKHNHGIRSVDINDSRSADEQSEELKKILGADLLDTYKQKILQIAEFCLKDDYNLYVALKYFKFLGLQDRIVERISKGIRFRFGNKDLVSGELFRATCEYGTEEQIKNATEIYIKKESITPLYRLEDNPYFKEKFEEIKNAIKKYSQFYNLPVGFPITAEILNVAMEIRKRDYDLAIGVMRSGALMAIILEMLGTKTKYLEWSRNWKKGPIWRKIGRDWNKTVEAGGKIMVCEHDTHTGATLKAIAPAIKNLKPKTLDICFWIDAHHTNKKIVESSEDYGSTFNLEDFPKDKFFDNLQNFLKAIRSDKFAESFDNQGNI